MIRVLYTTPFSDAIGGGQVGLLLLLERLDRNKFQPLLLVPGEGEVSERARRLGCDVRVFDFPPLRSIWKVIPTLWKLRQLLKDAGVSIIHTDEPRSTIYFILARLRLRIFVVWHIRTEGKDPPLDWLLERCIDRIILVARALETRFSRSARSKMRLIYNGVKIGSTAGVDRSSLPEVRSPLLICPGRLHISKGQPILIQAVEKLKPQFPTLSLWLVGKGDNRYAEDLKQQVRSAHLINTVHFLGYRTDLSGLLSLADLIVLPSLPNYEAFPRVILESMAAGKAVVASRVAGIPEQVVEGTTGLLVPPEDPERLAQAIAELLHDKIRRERMGEAARRQVERFSIDATVRSVEALYEELSAAGRERR